MKPRLITTDQILSGKPEEKTGCCGHGGAGCYKNQGNETGYSGHACKCQENKKYGK